MTGFQQWLEIIKYETTECAAISKLRAHNQIKHFNMKFNFKELLICIIMYLLYICIPERFTTTFLVQNNLSEFHNMHTQFKELFCRNTKDVKR